MDISLNGIPVTKPIDKPARFTSIIWGAVGSGKTPLSITSPPKILYLLFDNDGYKSVAHVSHLYDMIDLTGQPASIVDEFMSDRTGTYRDLNKLLSSNNYKTLVFDGITSFLERALTRGVDIIAPTVTKGIKPTYIQPQLSGYGARGAYMRLCALRLHELTAKYNVNLIFTAHEAVTYERNSSTGESEPAGYTMMLPGEAYVQVPKNISEIWLLHRNRIYVRSWGKYQPMRSRMFRGADYFTWNFNTYTWTGEGIETWMQRYDELGKIPIDLTKGGAQ